MESQQSKIVEEGPNGKDYLSGFVNILTVIAALLTIAPFLAALLGCNQQIFASVVPPAPAPAPVIQPVEPGLVLPSEMKSEACILESTTYNAEVSGYLARVTVKQRFRNPNNHKISGSYIFPLSDRSAVDEMNMQIGDRNIKGEIKESEEARQIYARAQAAGRTATLLEQVRTNIFTQSVANIEPGKPIDVTIKYTETLPFKDGEYSLVFPSKVGPRFIPAGCQGNIASALSVPNIFGDKTAVSVNVTVNEGGIPITKISSPSHPFQIATADPSHASMAFASNNADEKDMVINWQMASNEVKSGYLTHKVGKDGFVTAMILPPAKVTAQAAAPKEMLFVMDCSGSQSGAPIEKAKDTLEYIVDHMNPRDTFQIISFNNSVQTFPKEPKPMTAEMKSQAHAFIRSLSADGGTVMAPAIEAACNVPVKENRLRIVTLMTDGYIGNDYEIIGMVKKLRGNSRWFPFGTGNSVNRTLIDGVAKEGGGEPEFVLLNSDSEDIAKRFYNRIANPVLTNIHISAEGVQLSDIYPARPSDVWEQRPLYVQARYTKPGQGYIVVKGYSMGKPYTQKLPVVLPDRETSNTAIPQTWAHSRIDELMSMDWQGMQSGNPDAELKKNIIDTSLNYHVLSQFTSFVAVDSSFKVEEAERIINQARETWQKQVVEANRRASTPLPTLSPDLGLQQSISQSFSTVTNQLNRLNSIGPNDANYFSAGDAFDSTASAGYSYNNTSNYTGSQNQNSAFFQGTNYTGSQTHQGGNSAAPMLQGATNACIGPQGCDATVIQGVNTAGTVRVSNLESLGLLISNLAALAQYAWLLSAVILLCALTLNRKLAVPSTRKRLWISCLCFTLIALNLPNTVGWLITSARNANLI